MFWWNNIAFWSVLAPAGTCAVANDTTFAYVQVWKSANDFFTNNLEAMCRGKLERVPPSAEGSRRVGSLGARQFTFVRDPWDHFMSGYTETTWRTFVQCCTHARPSWGCPAGQCNCSASSYPCAAQPQNTTDLARDFVVALLDADRERVLSPRHALVHPDHMYPQAGLLRVWHPEFVGHLETLQQDWDHVAAWLDMPRAASLDAKLGRHETSSDPLGRRAALSRLFRAEPKWRDAILHLLRIDFDCWPNLTSTSTTEKGDADVEDAGVADAGWKSWFRGWFG